MMKLPGVLLVLALGLALSGCGDSSTSESKLTLTGSSTVAPLISEIAKRYEAANPDVRIDVQTGGSSRGIADANSGLADIGMSSRDLKEAERSGVDVHVLAIDGVAFVVHASNPVGELSDEQLTRLYRGEIGNWSQLGGHDRLITVINRAEGRSELDLVTSYLGIKPSDIKPDLVAGENQECVKLVAGNPDAIAYLSVGTAAFEIDRGTPLKMLPLQGVEASVDTVKGGTFPLNRPLVLVTPKDRDPAVQAFLDFALSGNVDDLIVGQSFVSPR